MTRTLPDPVPLGVAGSVTIPQKQYLAIAGKPANQNQVLLEEAERLSYLAGRLADAVDQPLNAGGSQGLARLVLEYFQDMDIMSAFAEKALETLRDGQQHNRSVINRDDPQFAISFIAWNGTHREVQAERVGNYLGALYGTARKLVERGFQLAGFLEMDAYVRDNPDPDAPGMPLDEVFQVDLEYSYLPGFMFGSSATAPGLLSNSVIVNPDLCTAEEKKVLKKLMAP